MSGYCVRMHPPRTSTCRACLDSPWIGKGEMAYQTQRFLCRSNRQVSPLDGQTYPNFLLMHPRDHIYHSSTKIPLKNGATATVRASWAGNV